VKGIAEPDPVRMKELKGIDDIIIKLRGNTEQFLGGLPCNNVLLYGPRGTGKSSAIKSLLNEYGKKGLRMIEMERDALMHLFDIGDLIRVRSEKFVIFCDDLAFEKRKLIPTASRQSLREGWKSSGQHDHLCYFQSQASYARACRG